MVSPPANYQVQKSYNDMLNFLLATPQLFTMWKAGKFEVPNIREAMRCTLLQILKGRIYMV